MGVPAIVPSVASNVNPSGKVGWISHVSIVPPTTMKVTEVIAASFVSTNAELLAVMPTGGSLMTRTTSDVVSPPVLLA